MDSVIINNNDEVIGYYAGLLDFLKDQARRALKDDEFELLSAYVEDLIELMKYKNSNKLLILSENNGMGVTISEFKQDQK